MAAWAYALFRSITEHPESSPFLGYVGCQNDKEKAYILSILSRVAIYALCQGEDVYNAGIDG